MSKPLTAAQLRAEALRVRAQGLALVQYADELERLAENAALTISVQQGTHKGVDAQPTNRGSSVSVARTRNPWPFSKALHAMNSSPPAWGRANGVDEDTVKSWLKRKGHGGRPCPRVYADRIAAEFPDVPAVDASWPCGIR